MSENENDVKTLESKALSGLNKAKIGAEISKTPLDLAKGEIFKGVITDRYERELPNGKTARYIEFKDMNLKIYISAAKQIVTALYREEIYTPVQITCIEVEESEYGHFIKTYEINLLITS